MENNYDFYTQNPKWQKIFFIVFLALSVAGIVTMTILMFTIKLDLQAFIALICIFAFFLLLSLLGVYVCIKEKFYFQNQTFTYVKPFKKSQSADVSQIARVELSFGSFIKVDFIGKNGEKLISFLDNGTSFKNKYFEKALFYYNIPIVRK